MAKQVSKGTCFLCKGEFSKATIARHLEAIFCLNLHQGASQAMRKAQLSKPGTPTLAPDGSAHHGAAAGSLQ
jgi:hypothetical protein